MNQSIKFFLYYNGINNSIQFVYFLGDLIIFKRTFFEQHKQHFLKRKRWVMFFFKHKMGYVLTKVDIIKSGGQLFCIFIFLTPNKIMWTVF